MALWLAPLVLLAFVLILFVVCACIVSSPDLGGHEDAMDDPYDQLAKAGDPHVPANPKRGG